MKNIVRFLLFIIYTISIFFIKNYILIFSAFIINLIIAVLVRVKIKDMLTNIGKLLVFILVTVIINAFMQDLKTSILIGVKLILVCNITYIFSKVLTYMEFATLIEKIFYPLKIFKINSKDIGLVVCIALTFIPILKDELNQIKNVLKVKGFKTSTINIIKNAHIVFQPFFVLIFKRINKLEDSLKVKGYQGESL